MKLSIFALLHLAGSPWQACARDILDDESLTSRNILPANFKPPQVFRNSNLVRTINLEKGYVRESINVNIENVDSSPQSEYFFPFEAGTIDKVGGFDVRDKQDPKKPAFSSETVEYDQQSSTQFYRVSLPEPLKPKGQRTLLISYHILSSLLPQPARIAQGDKQYLQYAFSTVSPSAYETQNQKTKIKFPSVDIPDYTGKPERQGTTFTYGPYKNMPAGSRELATIRYEYTRPVIHVSRLERDIEVSHWGGNTAFEERYWLSNRAAPLSVPFSRLKWAQALYFKPATTALAALNVPLKAGSVNAYYVDEIGNVSTSRFRPGTKDTSFELIPRYPIFGGWNFPFKIGWDASTKSFLRKVAKGDQHVLKVPFLEGPKMSEGVSYEKVDLRVILPEGATNVKFQTDVPLVSASESAHRTFMDTLGRTSLRLSAINVVDESRDASLVITYDYPFWAAFRKPITIFAGFLGVFATAWLVGQVDISIGKKP